MMKKQTGVRLDPLPIPCTERRLTVVLIGTEVLALGTGLRLEGRPVEVTGTPYIGTKLQGENANLAVRWHFSSRS